MSPRRRVMMGCVLVIGLGLFIGAPLTVAGGRMLESQPTFCASCHEERINFETWQSSGAARRSPHLHRVP
jgi:nitrate/TMAO reductase-like tetraheme cytochrome c subunit